MKFNSTNTTNRFWQQRQRFERAQNKHEMIKTEIDRGPQVLDGEVTKT